MVESRTLASPLPARPGLEPRARRRIGGASFFLLPLVLLTPAAVAQDPTAEQILARHVEARGGAEAWARIEALEITGTYTALSEEAEFTLWRQRPGRYRFEYGILGERATEGWDGSDGWMESAVEGWPWPVPMNAAQLAAVRSAAELDSPLMDAAAKGHQVELVGRSEFDGVDTWELRVHLANGNEETWHLDAESYLPVSRVYPAADFGSAVGTQEVFYDDFREAAGVKFPFFIQSEYFIRLNMWAVESIKVNPEIPDGFFSRPGPAGMAKLAPLAGVWKVKTESRSAPPAPWTEDGETASEIAPRLGGAMLEERLTIADQGRPVEAVRQWTWDRFQKVFRLAHTDTLSQHMNVLVGNFGGVPKIVEREGEGGAGEGDSPAEPPDPDTLILSNLETGTTIDVGQTVHQRESVSGIGPDGFTVERAVSTDGGKTWFVNVRLTYSRASE